MQIKKRILAGVLSVALVLGQGSVAMASEAGDRGKTDDFIIEKIQETEEPAEAPFGIPSEDPSGEPMQTLSEAPTETPSEEPMQTPSEAPNETSSEEPMQTPSETPSASPSEVPTQTPSEAPSKEPDSLFSGLSDEQSLSKEALAEKEVLALHAQEPERFLIGAEYVENEILVSADTYEEAEQYAAAFDGSLKKYRTPVAVITLNANAGKARVSVADAVMASVKSERLPAAWPNFYYETDAIDTDPYLSPGSECYQWYHSVIGSKEAWNAGYNGTGIKVAVIDTGILSNHEDVSATIVDIGAGTGDDADHGTQVAGLIAARGNNEKGGAGVAPGAELVSIRVLTESGELPTDLIIEGIYEAIDRDADIINMSLGGTGYSGIFQNAVTYAYNKGIAVICAAGNASTNSAHYPAAYQNTIGVASVDKDNYLSSFSNYGSYIRYCAPGEDIWSTGSESTASYTMDYGTSHAAAIVSGQAAVILSSGKVTETGKARVERLMKIMDASCIKVSGSGHGKGIVNLTKALGLSSVTTKPNKPVFTTKSGTIFSTKSQEITIQAENGMMIYYSLDGKNVSYKSGIPSANAFSCAPGEAIEIGGKASVTVKAIAVNPISGLVSSQVSATYRFKPVVDSVTVSSPTGTNMVAKGKTLKLTAAVTPSYAKNKTIKWTIDGNPAGISVKNGTVTVKNTAGTGEYIVRATAQNEAGKYEGAFAAYEIEVVEAENPVTKITVSPTTKLKVAQGATTPVTVTVLRKDGSKAVAAEELQWISNNLSIATVAANGDMVVIAGKKAGKTTITGCALDGSGKKTTLTVAVTQPAKEIEVTGATLLAAGKSTTLKAAVKPADTTNKKVKWSVVTDTKDISVSSAGKVTAKASAEGDYVIRATAAEQTAVYKDFVITVTKGRMTSLKLDKKSLTLFRVSNHYGAKTEEEILVATEGTDNLTAWEVSSSHPGIVSVERLSEQSFQVKATGKATGTATITVKSLDGSKLKATCKVTVNNPASRLYLSPEKNRSDYLANGKSMKLTPTWETAFGKTANSAKKLTWSSSDPALATVDKNGKVKAVSGNCRGVVITATATDGSGLSASYEITECGATTSFYLAGYASWTWDEIEHDSEGYYYYPITCEADNGYPSYKMMATVDKEGLSAIFAEINGKPSLCLTGNKKGTYKVTLSLRDGSSAKRVYKFVVS